MEVGVRERVDPDASGHASGHAPGFRRQDWLRAALVGAAAVGVAFALRSAIVPTDPWHYVQGALDFPDGTWRPAGLSRWGYVLPLIPFTRMWGDAEASYYVLPLITTGALAAVLYLWGRRLGGRWTGLAAVVVVLSTPLVLVNLTRGYTELTAAALVAWSLLLLTLAQDRAVRAHGVQSTWGWRTPGLLLVAGAAAGWSVEVRETAVFAFPVLAWVLWNTPHRWRAAAWFAGPVVVWAAVDLTLCAAIYDDALLKLRVVAGADIASSEVVSDSVYVGHSRWWYATIVVRSMLGLSGGPVLVALMAIGAIGGGRMRRGVGRVWAWGMLSFVLLWLQGGVLDPEHPSVRLDVERYWLSFVIPLALVAVVVVSRGVSALAGRHARLGLVATAACAAVVMFPALRFAGTYPGLAPNGGTAMSELRAHLAQTQELTGGRVWADWGTQRVLPAYQTGPFGAPEWDAAGFRSLNRLLREPRVARKRWPQPGEYVLLYSEQDRTCWHCRRALAPAERAFGPFPRPGWVPVFTSSTGNLRLYRIGPGAAWPELPPLTGGDAPPEPERQELT